MTRLRLKHPSLANEGPETPAPVRLAPTTKQEVDSRQKVALHPTSIAHHLQAVLVVLSQTDDEVVEVVRGC